MTVFDNPHDLAEKIISDLSDFRAPLTIIGIDGKDGIGKTPLAADLGSLLPAPVVSLDNFVDKNDQGTYIEFLKIDELQRQLSASEPRLIIEGVCLLAAAERCGFEVHKLIYVKRISAMGIWQDEEECGPDVDPEAVIQRMVEDYRKASELAPSIFGEKSEHDADKDFPELTKEIIRYHANYRPIDRADYIYHQDESKLRLYTEP